jgi:hypothetical protein
VPERNRPVKVNGARRAAHQVAHGRRGGLHLAAGQQAAAEATRRQAKRGTEAPALLPRLSLSPRSSTGHVQDARLTTNKQYDANKLWPRLAEPGRVDPAQTLCCDFVAYTAL